MGLRKDSYKKKKRNFGGNQHSSTCKSRSSKKLRHKPRLSSPSTSTSPRPRPVNPKANLVSNNPVGNRFIDMELLCEGIQSSLSCKVCQGEIYLAETNVKGLGSKILLQCKSCDPKTIGNFHTSKIIEGTSAYEVNRRTVYSMRSIGVGLQGLNKFCGVMNMPPPVKPNTYNLINQQILLSAKKATDESTKKAVIEEVRETESLPKTDITVSGDGTWMKRGHTSLHGVCTIIGANTGKILDVESLSSFCHGCNSWKGPKSGPDFEKWLNDHKANGQCRRNHFGSAGSMEVEGMKQMFHRSEEKLGVRYTSYIGDGDTATFGAVRDSLPYGPNVSLVKEECVGHVQKRMYSRLKKLKDKNKSKILADGKKIGGKNRLTDPAINQLCVYYGNAIRANTNDLTNMRKAIWAIWNHKASTDIEPIHDFCPEGPESWCTYQKARALNTLETYKHKNTIPRAIMDVIKPVFTDLSMPALLRRCLKGKTQNANESYNNILWSVCPKKGFVGAKVIEIAAYEAALVYNDGNKSKSKVLENLKIFPGKHFEKSMKNLDVTRVIKAEKKTEFETLEARKGRRLLRLQKEQRDKETEGVTYAAGEF